MWKNGQLVTINHTTYKIIKPKKYKGCFSCAFSRHNGLAYPCNECTDGRLIDEGLCFKRVHKLSDYTNGNNRRR